MSITHTIEVDGVVRIRGTVHAPDRVDEQDVASVLYCLPGGSCTTGYFDLEVPGLSGYSMAAHLADLGHVVITMDHPGIGRSDRVDDLYAFHPWAVADVHDAASAQLRARLADGTLVDGLGPVRVGHFVGVGHSMGGMLIDVQQATHATFDATAVLGTSGAGLPQFLSDEEEAASSLPLDERAAAISRLARAKFAEPIRERSARTPGRFFAADVPRPVIAAFVAQQTELLYPCGLAAMIPRFTAAEKGRITVPVFASLADGDLVVDLLATAADYTASDDVTMFRLTGAAHCHNQAATRHVLWDRLDRWVRALS